MVFKHPSFILDNTNNYFERLEFLGDRVLGLTIAHFLFKTFYDESEGDLAQRISELVSKKTLLEISNKLDFKQYMILLNGDKSSKVINDTILSDTLEALIGAIFIDGGFLKAKHFILSILIKTSVHNELKRNASRFDVITTRRPLNATFFMYNKNRHVPKAPTEYFLL